RARHGGGAAGGRVRRRSHDGGRHARPRSLRAAGDRQCHAAAAPTPRAGRQPSRRPDRGPHPAGRRRAPERLTCPDQSGRPCAGRPGCGRAARCPTLFTPFEKEPLMSAVFVFTTYGGPEGQMLTEREPPAPGPGEIAIEVHAAGVNPADWKRREGAFGTRGALPVAMGLEAAGVVTAVGEGVDEFAVGDEVLGAPARGLGAFAEHTVLAASQTVAKPEAISFADAATIPVAGTTAYDLTHQVELEAGQTLLVIGAGGGVG